MLTLGTGPGDSTGEPLEDAGWSGGGDALIPRVLEKDALDLVGGKSFCPLLGLSMGHQGQGPIHSDSEESRQACRYELV